MDAAQLTRSFGILVFIPLSRLKWSRTSSCGAGCAILDTDITAKQASQRYTTGTLAA
jgi:hypothetical protein